MPGSTPPSHPRLVLGARSRLAGLDRRSLGPIDVIAHSVAVMAPCAAGATIPLLVMESGSALVWSVLAAIALAALVAIVLREFTSRMTASGGLYTFAAKGLGPAGGLAAAAAMTLGYGALGMFALSQSAYFGLRLVGVHHPSTAQVAVAVAAIGVCVAATLIRGIRVSARAGLIIEAVAVTIVLAVIGVLLLRHSSALDPGAIVSPPTGVASFCVGVALATCGLIGFESAATVSVEAQRPLRTVPSAISVSLLIGSLVVLIATVAQAANVSALTAVSALADGDFDVMADAVGVGWVAPITNVGIVASFLACTLASTTSLTRTLMSLAREGLIPERFGQTHPQTRTPAFGITVAVLVMVVAAAVPSAAGMSAEAVRSSMASAPSIGFIAAYVIVAVAAPMFLRRTGELRRTTLVVALTAAVAFSAVLIVFVVVSFGTDRACGVVAALGWFVLAGVGALILALCRPQAARGIGIHETPTRGEVWSGHRSPVAAGPRPLDPT